MTDLSRRHEPRVSFAGRAAPRLETPSGSFEVVDLSVDGIRFRAPNHEGPTVTIGEVLRATIRFPADRSVDVAGRVLRVAGDEAAAQLERGEERVSHPLPMGPSSPRRSGLLW
jgi:PilZ domain